jgi:hypothetical protein
MPLKEFELKGISTEVISTMHISAKKADNDVFIVEC